MDKEKIARTLLETKAKGLVPLFLDIEGETSPPNLQKASGVLFFGVGAAERLSAVAASLSVEAYDKLEFVTEAAFLEFYKTFLCVYANSDFFSPPKLLLLPNIEALCANSPSMRRRLSMVLRNCNECHIRFLACVNAPELSEGLVTDFLGWVGDSSYFVAAACRGASRVFEFVGFQRRIRPRKSRQA